jgi:hypothetical protein
MFFLAFASKQGFIVDSYEDNAAGIMEKNEKDGCPSPVELRPHTVFSGQPFRLRNKFWRCITCPRALLYSELYPCRSRHYPSVSE